MTVPLAIIVVEQPTRTTTCGGARSEVRWAVQGTGFIIQHIQVVNGRRNCFTGKLLPLVGWTTTEYWECWNVSAGKVKYEGGLQTKWDDCFEIPDQGRTRGNARIIGEVKFFPNYKPGKAWRKDQVPEAGILKTTTTPPPGWNSSGALAHTLESQWVCCRGEESGAVIGAPERLSKQMRRPSPQVKQVLELLSDMPKWSEIDAHDRRAQKVIEEAAAGIGRNDLRVIRSAIREYLKRANGRDAGPEIGDLSRIFVLNRYLFDVPSHVALGEIRVFGGWHGNQVRHGVTDWLWPWKVTGQRKRLTGSFKGYSGPPYFALPEFDYFRRTFSPARAAQGRVARSRKTTI